MAESIYALNYDITTSHEKFISAGWRGPWTLLPGVPVFCPECTRCNQRLGTPLEITWEPGVGNIGDFTWMLNNDVLVTNSVAEKLAKHFKGLQFDPIVYRKRGNPFMRRTRMMTYNSRAIPADFQLYHLKINQLVSCDVSKSTLTFVNRCKLCGCERYDLTDVEHWVGRKRGRGLFVRRDDVRGVDLFRINQYAGPQLVTESVKKFIESEGLTNVIFIEYGEFF